jgi:hypothetical protein
LDVGSGSAMSVMSEGIRRLGFIHKGQELLSLTLCVCARARALCEWLFSFIIYVPIIIIILRPSNVPLCILVAIVNCTLMYLWFVWTCLQYSTESMVLCCFF